MVKRHVDLEFKQSNSTEIYMGKCHGTPKALVITLGLTQASRTVVMPWQGQDPFGAAKDLSRHTRSSSSGEDLTRFLAESAASSKWPQTGSNQAPPLSTLDPREREPASAKQKKARKRLFNNPLHLQELN